MTQIQIGSKVKIKPQHKDNTWDYYRSWADEHGLKGFCPGARPLLDKEYVVVAIGEHSPESPEITCYGIEADGASHIMSKIALELVEQPFALDTQNDYTFSTCGGDWGLRFNHAAQEWKCYGADFAGADKHQGALWSVDRISGCLQDGSWYNLKAVGYNPAPATHPSAGILEPFDRVVTKYGTFIVADFKFGRYLIGQDGNWLDINDFNATPVLAVYKAPVLICDVFDVSLKGEKKWEHPNNARQRELAAKIATLQDELTAANEELDALNN